MGQLTVLNPLEAMVPRDKFDLEVIERLSRLDERTLSMVERGKSIGARQDQNHAEWQEANRLNNTRFEKLGENLGKASQAVTELQESMAYTVSEINKRMEAIELTASNLRLTTDNKFNQITTNLTNIHNTLNEKTEEINIAVTKVQTEAVQVKWFKDTGRLTERIILFGVSITSLITFGHVVMHWF